MKIVTKTLYLKGFQSKSPDYSDRSCNMHMDVGGSFAVPTKCKLNTPAAETVYDCVPNNGTQICPYAGPENIGLTTNVAYNETDNYKSRGCAPGTAMSRVGPKCMFADGNLVYDCLPYDSDVPVEESCSAVLANTLNTLNSLSGTVAAAAAELDIINGKYQLAAKNSTNLNTNLNQSISAVQDTNLNQPIIVEEDPTWNLELCGNLGYEGADSDGNSIRLYSQAECENNLQGNWYSNGECIRKTGGSYSGLCGAINGYVPDSGDFNDN
ncbi:MAG: hypothetical protein EBU33_08505, partial [Sphingobacteriia bacterium]|nr:hypothetical protein [Sphingobacteriia bacterium]